MRRPFACSCGYGALTKICAHALDHRAVVNVQHQSKGRLIAPGQVPRDRQPELAHLRKHHCVPTRKLLIVEKAAKRIVDVRVSSRLVKQDIAARELLNQSWQ